MAISASLIGRLGGGIEWQAHPAFDANDPFKNMITITGPSVLLVDAGAGYMAEAISDDAAEFWATADYADHRNVHRLLGLYVEAGNWVIRAMAHRNADVFVPTRYAILPMED